ncbi:MAG: DUF1592 domain-containing protein [Vicinamibacterales bacterium]
MKKVLVVLLGLPLAALVQAAPPGASGAAGRPSGVTAPVASHGPAVQAAAASADDRALVTTYCVGCHNDARKIGGLSLEAFDPVAAADQPQVAEKIIRKLTAGMMPPAGARRPEPAVLAGFASGLEARVDRAAARHPSPGWRPSQRLTRAEYQRAIDDLLGLDIDVTAYLPPDTITDGFDNVADAQTFSPALLDGYLRAAGQISRLAVGDRQATATTVTYKVAGYESQMRHVEGTPFGARGGLAVTHVFPADGDYTFRALFVRTVSGELFGNTAVALQGSNEQLEITVDGERKTILEVHPGMSDGDVGGLSVTSEPIHLTAGPHVLSAAFIPHSVGPVDDLLTPIEHTLIDTRYGTGFGITAAPHLQDVTILGPLEVTGISDNPVRRRIFSCRPTTASEEAACAATIVRRLATQAFRGAMAPADFEDVMGFYEQGRKEGDFESGIRLALQAILAHPRFLFRLETEPTRAAAAGAPAPVGDVELASRLSFFLWGTVPDAELIEVASQGRLSQPAVYAQQVRRMLDDPRSDALATRFWSQWLRLQDVDKLRPDGLLYPYWDKSLSEGFRRETELFFDNLVHEDRSLLEMLTADYTFVNERVARHYGIPNVTGNSFRRVALPPERRGILTQGSILLLTSVADRTSPVQRGKWVMQVMLGSPPPPPPPNVPALDATKGVADGRVLTVRQRMEQHRANPACNSCHRVIDPIGLALENFDVTGRYRIKDNGAPVEVTGTLYDGTEMDGPAGLRDALLAHREALLRSFTESLMTYALGRRVEYYDMPTVREIVRDAARQDYKVSAFIQGVANSPAFRMRGPETTEMAAAGGR